MEFTQAQLDEIQQLLKRLHSAVDDIIAQMQPAEWQGCINWGDLGCKDAVFGVDEDRRYFCRVVVEEAAQGETAFCRHIEQELAKRGWPDVEVATEW